MVVEVFIGHPALAAFYGLGIQSGHTQARLPGGVGHLALAAHLGLVERRPVPTGLPAAEIIVDQRKRWKLMRQYAPLVTILGKAEQRIAHQTHLILAAAYIGQYFLNNLLLEISQVRSVHLCSDEKIR